ncbi:TPA: UDP-galactopyranose mutase [Vibrio vulnificus]|nr:UDP-galactopyranose mutase [Vibrio vulnificus]
MYDYIIVGAGLFGAVCANKLKEKGKRILVLEKRDHIGGNVYTEKIKNINIHKYGAHIFHTNDEVVWNYVNSFVEFNRFTNSPLANYKGELYNLPFNMNTFYQLWGVLTPKEALEKIEEQKKEIVNIKNLEDQAISLVGKDIYEKLIKGYTEKQWGRNCKELPAFIIKRLPVRFTFDNNYFSDKFQGIPINGYTEMIEKMLEGIDVKLNTDFLSNKEYYESITDKVIYTGPIDEYFDTKLGKLEYRSLQFESEVLEIENYQGNAVINYTEKEIPFTRIIEHKHFSSDVSDCTVITREYPKEFESGDVPYYPINDDRNMELYKKYRRLSKEKSNVIFGGRLAEYKYYDMHQVIRSAINAIEKLN